MADDVYTTLLSFVSETSEANRDITQTTENLKKMEEQAKKVSQSSSLKFNASASNSLSQELSKTFENIHKKAQALGITISEDLANSFKTGMISDAALEELAGLEKRFSETFTSAATGATYAKVKINGIAKELNETEKAAFQAQKAMENSRREANELRRMSEPIRKEPDPRTFQAFPGDELSKDFALFNEAFGETYGVVNQKLVELGTGTKVAADALREFSGTSVDELQKIVAGEQEVQKSSAESQKEVMQGARIRALLYTREASLLRQQSSDIRENAQIIRDQAQQLQQISQVVLGIGVGIVGGIFGLAQKYVNNAKEATTVTVAWKEAQESLGKSGQKIGAVLAQEALPLLRLASETAAKAAGFIEKHPEIVRAALNAGLVIAGLGAVGLAVSKGIKLYADQLYLSSIPLQLQAGQLQFAAAQEQLIAAKLRAGTITPDQVIPTSAPTQRGPVGGGNILGTLAKVTLVASAVVIGAELGLALGNAIARLIDPEAKDQGLGETLFYGAVRPVEAIVQKFQQVEKQALKFLTLTEAGDKNVDNMFGKANGILIEIDKFFENMLVGAKELEEASEKIAGVRGSANFDAVLKAYESYKQEDLLLVQKHYAEREKVIADSLRAQAAENAEYARNVARVNTQTGGAIREATRAYEQQSIQEEVQFATERARIIRDGGIEIQKIEENLQESLRKLRQEHEDRLEVLVTSRDAYGIAEEQRRYNRERNETTRQANLEIRQRRADLAIRLADLQQNYQQERAERFVEFQARLAEIRANAAEQLKELAARHQEELTQIRIQRTERIKELDTQFQEEHKRRYEYFIAQIRDLDASLLGEAELRKQRQNEMIAELDAFLLRYKTGLAQLHTAPIPGRAQGGYATYGTYLLGDSSGGGRGKPEYVLNGSVTELAERVLGGRISQEKMSALFGALSGGSRNNVVYNDSRRIDSKISDIDRQRMIDDTLSAVAGALG